METDRSRDRNLGRRVLVGFILMLVLLACNLIAAPGSGSPSPVPPTSLNTPGTPIQISSIPPSGTTPGAGVPTIDPAVAGLCPHEATGGGNILQVSPVLGFNGQCYWIPANTFVTVSWPGVRKDATSVEFYYMRVNSTSKADTIGIDRNLSDGASVSWQTYPGISGTLYALEILPVKSAWSDAVNVFSKP